MLNILAAVQSHWELILTCLTAVSSICSGVAANTDHAGREQSILLKVVGVLSFLEHQNVTGWKLPGMPSQAPTVPSATTATSITSATTAERSEARDGQIL